MRIAGVASGFGTGHVTYIPFALKSAAGNFASVNEKFLINFDFV